MAFSTSSQQSHTESGVYKSLGWKIVAGFVVVALLPPAIMFVTAADSLGSSVACAWASSPT